MGDPLQKFIASVCVQTAVYWGGPTPDGYGGTSYDSPVEISCRWDGKVELIRDAEGNEVVSRAEVMVTQDVEEGGMLYLGSLSDLDSSKYDSPEDVEDAYKILQFVKTPQFMSTTNFVRTAYL